MLEVRNIRYLLGFYRLCDLCDLQISALNASIFLDDCITSMVNFSLSPVRMSLAFFAACLLAVPVLATVVYAVAAGLNTSAWQHLAADAQWLPALAMSLWTGLASSVIALGLAAAFLSRVYPGARWQRLVQRLPPMLALPHAAFAIGLAFLIAPSGWLLRLLSPWATGFDAPPPWPTTQDPWGIGLIAVLVAKEVPFLLWVAATQLQRPEVAARWMRDLTVARSMGYSAGAAWWRVVWPQLWPRLRWPFLAVLAYGLTVVDMALVIGPTLPPTLAVLAWQWLLDADTAINAKGAAAAWLLAALVATVAGAGWALAWLMRTKLRSRWSQGIGAQARSNESSQGRLSGAVLVTLYLAVMAALAVGSVAGVWPFPAVWPESLSLQAWQSVASSSHTLTTTATLAFASSLTAVAWAVLWLETAPPRWDAWLYPLLWLPLVLPAVLWVLGLHRLLLAWGLDARWTGLWLAHSLATAPYVLMALAPGYRSFDPRYWTVAASLQSGRLRFLLRVQWPLLKAPLWSALAVGFAVSTAQYLPTVFIGAGRFSTVTTEAVSLASGAQRSLTAAYAWLQWLLPALVFGLAARLGRPRRFARIKASILSGLTGTAGTTHPTI